MVRSGESHLGEGLARDENRNRLLRRLAARDPDQSHGVEIGGACAIWLDPLAWHGTTDTEELAGCRIDRCVCADLGRRSTGPAR